jgi:molecular chaperone GrpE
MAGEHLMPPNQWESSTPAVEQPDDAPSGAGLRDAGAAPGTQASEEQASGEQTPGERAAGERAAELEDNWRRALADLDNMRKRHAKELTAERGRERAEVASAWLPVVDDLDRALEHTGPEDGSLVTGVRAVRDEAVAVLARLGYPRREETGVPFDPARHEVAAVINAPDAEPGTVMGVVRPGYGDPGNQLRPVAVTVAGQQE